MITLQCKSTNRRSRFYFLTWGIDSAAESVSVYCSSNRAGSSGASDFVLYLKKVQSTDPEAA